MAVCFPVDNVSARVEIIIRTVKIWGINSRDANYVPTHTTGSADAIKRVSRRPEHEWEWRAVVHTGI
jgi:hypothetical protein